MLLCKMLNVYPSGFYPWVNHPLSPHVLEEALQTVLIKEAWKNSGKIYEYRKIHDDLIEMGERRVSENRVPRLARFAGIQAQIGNKKSGRGYPS